MSRNLGFARKFIILKKEFSNMRQVNPKGHGKLELRGSRLNFILNIDNAEKNNFYNVLFLRDGKTFDLGKIFTDDNYIGKADFNLNHKELEEMGFSIDRINGILITRDKNVLLGGYFGKNDKSIEKYMEKLKTKKIEVEEYAKEPVPEEIKNDTVKDEVVEEVEDQIVEELEERQENQQTQEIIEEKIIEEKAIEERQEIIEIEERQEAVEVEDVEEIIIEEEIRDEAYLEEPIAYSINTEEEYDEAMSTIFHQEGQEDTEEVYIPPVDSESEDRDIDESRDYYSDIEREESLGQRTQTTNYILNILSFFPYTEPFRINLQGYNWWKIDIEDPKEDKGFLPYFSYITAGNHKYPIIENTITANDLMRRYGHYLFGLYNVEDEVKFYVYGIPGRFTQEDHPQKGTTGFNTWFEAENYDGYWLLYIDPQSGRIIYPINPMIPIE